MNTDIPDLIAGALGVSRGTAYDMMREALAEQPAQQDIEELTAQRDQLADILTRTANALKGQPAELSLHSWHDLPEVAQQLRAAQQQEPVAIVEAVVPHLESIVVKHILDAPFPKVGDFLYTSPPASKPWVGLTDEQIGMAFRKAFPVGGVVFTNGAIDFARAIEAKLREKNT